MVSHESGAQAALVAALNDLRVKAGLTDNGRIIRYGRHQSPPVDFKPQTLSDWFTGRSVPSNSRNFKIMINYLQEQARKKSGRQPTDWQWWEQLRLRAREERRAGSHLRSTKRPLFPRSGPHRGRSRRVIEETGNSRQSLRVLFVTPALRVLFVISDPPNITERALDEEMQSLVENVGGGLLRVGIEVGSARVAQPDDLLKAVDEFQPAVIHFTKHWSFPFSGYGHMRCSQLVTSQSVLQLLDRAARKNLRVVLLGSCYSYEVAKEVSAVVPCVLGWRLSLYEAEAAAFFSSFYRALCFGATVKEAVEQGRASILLEGLDDDGAEVIRLICRGEGETARLVELSNQPTSENAHADLRPLRHAIGLNTVPLLNEAECAEYLRDVFQMAQEATLTYLDIDGLLAINKVYGSHIGDLVLEECGNLIRQHYDELGHVRRLRGDQFVIAETVAGNETVATRAREVLQKIRTYDWSNISRDLHVSATASSAYRQPGEDIPSLILRAILGVKEAKRRGKGAFGAAPVALPKLDGGPNAQWHARLAQIPVHLSDDAESSYEQRLQDAGFSKLQNLVKNPDRVIEPEYCDWCDTSLNGSPRAERIQVVDHFSSGIIEYVYGLCPKCGRMNPPKEP